MLQIRVLTALNLIWDYWTLISNSRQFLYLTLKKLMCVTGPISYSLSNTLAEELLRHTGSAHPDSEMGLRVSVKRKTWHPVSLFSTTTLLQRKKNCTMHHIQVPFLDMVQFGEEFCASSWSDINHLIVPACKSSLQSLRAFLIRKLPLSSHFSFPLTKIFPLFTCCLRVI